MLPTWSDAYVLGQTALVLLGGFVLMVVLVGLMNRSFTASADELATF